MMKKMLKLMVLFVLCLSVNIFAAVTWAPAAEGTDWTTPSSWLGGVVPVAADIVELTSAYSCEVNSATAGLKELNTGNGSTAVLNVNSGGTVNMGGGGHINVGRRGNSMINVYDGGSIINTGGARIGMGWTTDSIINQYGGYVKPSVLLSIADNSVYNISGGTLDISDGDNSAVKIGVNNVNPDSILNISGTGEVVVTGNCYMTVGLDSRNGGKGVVNQSGGYLNLSTCAKDLTLGLDANTRGIYNISGGDVDVLSNLLVGTNGYGEFNQSGGTTDITGYVLIGKYYGSNGKLTVSGGTFTTASGPLYVGNAGIGTLEISGGTFNCTNTVRLGALQDAQGFMTISGGSVNISNYLQAADPIAEPTVPDPNQYAELTVIGSQATNITVGGRLDFRNKYNAKINFVFDAGGITPIECADYATLEGTTITYGVAEGQGLAIGAQYDAVISANGVAIDGTNVFVDESDIYDFSYAVVDLAEGGQALRFTVTGINYADCAEAIAAGISIPADINLDCVVNLEDFAIIASQWMDCNDPSGVNCQ